MPLSHLKVCNFKSFDEIDVELQNFNILIGANAVGKSNFIQLFRFLKHIDEYGLENAISLQGGVEYICNIALGSSVPLSISLSYSSPLQDKYSRISYRHNDDIISFHSKMIDYDFELKFISRRRGFGYIVANELINLSVEFFSSDNKSSKSKSIGEGKVQIRRTKDKIDVKQKNMPSDIKLPDGILMFPLIDKVPSDTLLINLVSFMFPSIRSLFSGISLYDFDPKLPKQGSPITGKRDLEEDGSNLSIVLKYVLSVKEWKRKLSNLIHDMLPFITDLSVEQTSDKSLLFNLKEKFFKKHSIPASLISDGTINIIAIILCLYFGKINKGEQQLIIIEEPERNIHPHLIAKLVDMMKDASRDRQIIVSTHNPEMLKHACLEDILLVRRNEEGFSKISRLSERKELKIFLENDMGIDDLYTQKLLEY